ncbi:hypothetical protein [Streptomyces sp. URMC 124]|uniref:hypothetical protein n=1 Tax=Streptomyces sp. URMC 124 TaxID=3423405 RepID=UPI003F19D7DC
MTGSTGGAGVGVLKESQYQDLTGWRDGQDRSRHGWAANGYSIGLKAVDALRKIGLCEIADADTLSRLRPGRSHWAARLTATEPRLHSVAYAVWLEGRARSVGPANSLARGYGNQYERTNRSS